MSPLVLLALGMLFVVGGILWVRLHPFVGLTGAAILVAVLTPAERLAEFAAAREASGAWSASEAAGFPEEHAVSRVATAFGDTCGSIGLLIAMAAIIGQCLVQSGGARRIVDGLIRAFGESRAPLAFLVAGFVLAIPVFFDTVFYLLMPLGLAYYRAARRDYLLCVLCIVAGATMAHSLVPPTPGPLFVADKLGVGIGAMMAGGLVVGTGSVLCGYLFARWVNATPLGRNIRPLGDAEAASGIPPAPSDDDGPRPALIAALLPIVLPVALIALGAVVSVTGGPEADAAPSAWRAAAEFFGDKTAALIVGAIAALVLLATSMSTGRREALWRSTGEALSSGAVIILITAAGGAFGAMLNQTGIANSIRTLAEDAHIGILPLVFLVTAAVRTAQGSATVAMITAAPVAAAFIGDGTLAFHPVYLALAVGCGSKPIPWMNDSGFWIITRMAGLRETDTLRFVSTMMSLMGVAGLILVMIAAHWLPFR